MKEYIFDSDNALKIWYKNFERHYYPIFTSKMSPSAGTVKKWHVYVNEELQDIGKYIREDDVISDYIEFITEEDRIKFILRWS